MLKKFEEFSSNKVVEINESITTSKIVEIDAPKSDHIEPINTIELCIDELKEKHLTNEAVDSIELSEDSNGKFIQFNIKCETDIDGSVNEYNGHRLEYNHICKVNEEIQDDIEEDNPLVKYLDIIKKAEKGDILDTDKTFFVMGKSGPQIIHISKIDEEGDETICLDDEGNEHKLRKIYYIDIEDIEKIGLEPVQENKTITSTVNEADGLEELNENNLNEYKKYMKNLVEDFKNEQNIK